MNKMDFAIVISAERCNPNGDPLNENQPRIDYDGYGIISDVCLKRKIRNRLQDLSENILIVQNDRITDGLKSIKERIYAYPTLGDFIKLKDPESFVLEACKTWFDVRAFGQVFAFRPKEGGVSIPVRGPVTIRHARSLNTVDIISMQITKSINTDTPANGDKNKKDSSTFGMKYYVEKGAYVAYGSIFPQLAEKTGFTEKDADILKKAMATLLENDASAARPGGSMDSRLYFWTHSSKIGNASSVVVHQSLNISPLDTWPYFSCAPEILSGIKLEVL